MPRFQQSAGPGKLTETSLTRDCYRLVAIAAAIPFLALLALFAFDVPIGQPFFLIYRYSSFWLVRIMRALPALLICLGGVALLYRAARCEREIPAGTALGLGACYLALVVWAFVAPPSFRDQHTFNMLSPSHEGAFVLEARKVQSTRDYVSRDFYERLQRTPEEMRGRRVLSNPPGTTVAVVLVRWAVEGAPWLRGAIIGAFGLDELEDAEQETEFAAAMLFAIVLTLAWSASVFPAYWLCRLWLPQLAASCVALAMVFNPATVTFTPGKDPAQMLTVCLILAGWFGGYVRRKWVYGAVAGIAFTIGISVGLVHVWVLGIAATATLIHALLDEPSRFRDWLLHCCLPAAAAAGVITLVAALALDWNLLRTVRAVASRYAEIQLPIITDPFYWTLLGLPMFLLFVGPLFWAQLIALRQSAGGPVNALGRLMTWCTVAVLTYTYFFANNSETPRLWMPFVSPLLLAMALRRLAFNEDSPANRRLMVLLIALQLGLTIGFWTLMDVRESEWRLLTGRMWE